MSSIVGFTLFRDLSPEQAKQASIAQQRALHHFDHLEHVSLVLGRSTLAVWGRASLTDAIHCLPDGSRLVLVGSPSGKVCWSEVEASMARSTNAEQFQLPWDGRLVLLKISADGQRWTLWNDWVGSIPVFHATIGQGHIASTIEPVVVAGAGFVADDIFLPGLLSLLINGHFVGDWTLFRQMKVVPPDVVAHWEDERFEWQRLWTIQPTCDRWETSWHDLIDELYELTRQAIAEVLETHPTWIVPLSAGLDSRLIVAVGADIGANMQTYAWGAPDATDVVYSRKVARTLGFPWQHIELRQDFLATYTKQWADCFGSAMHFHGMYQMAFLDMLSAAPAGPIASGFLGDVLSGDGVCSMMSVHAPRTRFQVETDDYTHWHESELQSLLKWPFNEAVAEGVATIQAQLDTMPGSLFQKVILLDLWNRQHYFTYFQTTLCDYWRGIATPFINRALAQFCLSLPRAALDQRRLLGDVYRRYYGRLAVIPGTYAQEPFILTGRHLLKERLAKSLPQHLRRGPLNHFQLVPLRLDQQSIQFSSKAALWPIDDAWTQLGQWIELEQIETTSQAIWNHSANGNPLKKLQSIQALAYRLLTC